MSTMRTFDHFPETATCPICGDSNDGACTLIPIDGTDRDDICEGQPTHLACLQLMGWRLNREAHIIYRLLPEVTTP